MSPAPRKADLDDIPAVMAGLIRLRDRGYSTLMKYAQPETARAGLTTFVEWGQLYIVGDFAVIASMGHHLWYSPDTFVIEELVIKISDFCGNPVTDVTKFLDEYAQQCGAVAVVTGDAQSGRMGATYVAKGYQLVAQQFVKEIHGMDQTSHRATGGD